MDSMQFHDRDWKYLQSAIPKAEAAGMNRIQLSHDIIMNIHQLFHQDTLQLVRRAAQLAHQHNLAVDVWTHELDNVPQYLKQGDKVVLDDKLWTWLQRRYKRAFELVPQIDGVVLTFAETEFKVYGNRVISNLPPAERVAKLITIMAEVCAQHRKLLFVRTFVHQPDALQILGQSLTIIADKTQQHPNIIVMSKCVPHDWTPYYPYNPLLGKTDGLPQIVEIDLGQEYTGQSKILHCEVDYVCKVLAYARRKNVVGAVARIERLTHNRALDTPNEVNIYAFSRLLNDPTVPPEKLWIEWATKRYGPKAAPYIIQALKPTFEITNLTFFPLGHWFTKHSKLPDFSYAYNSIIERQTAKWISAPIYELRRDELLTPTPITLMKLNAEKDLAAKLAQYSLNQLEKAKPYLSTEDYNKLRHYLEFGKDNVEVFRRHNLAMFTTLMLLNARKQVGPMLTKEELAHLQNQAVARVQSLREIADIMEQRYGSDVWPGNPTRIRNFANELEKRLSQPSN